MSKVTLRSPRPPTIKSKGGVASVRIARGKTGPQGPPGSKGDPGDKGDQGNDGPQGSPGVGSIGWAASTVVGSGDVRMAPDGSLIKSNSSRTTRSSFDATEQGNWTAVLATAGTVEQVALKAAYLSVNEGPLDAARYGVVSDGTTDDATALTAAITAAGLSTAPYPAVMLPRGTAKVASKITLPAGMWLMGRPGSHSEIRGTHATDPAVEFGSGGGHRLENLEISASGGGVALNIPSAHEFRIAGCLLVQYQASKAILKHSGSGAFLNATIRETTFNATAGFSVPQIDLSNSAGALNTTRWRDCLFNGSATATAPFAKIVSTSTGIWACDHSFRDITAEFCPAGVIYAESCANILIDQVMPWDVTTYTDDVFKFSTNATSGKVSRAITVKNSGRRGGTLTAGKYDVNFESGAQYVLAENMWPTTSGDVPAIHLPTQYGLSINCGYPQIQTSYWIASRPWSVTATTDRNAAAATNNGCVYFDATTKKLVYSDGTNWRRVSDDTIV